MLSHTHVILVRLLYQHIVSHNTFMVLYNFIIQMKFHHSCRLLSDTRHDNTFVFVKLRDIIFCFHSHLKHSLSTQISFFCLSRCVFFISYLDFVRLWWKYSAIRRKKYLVSCTKWIFKVEGFHIGYKIKSRKSFQKLSNFENEMIKIQRLKAC